LQVAVIFEVFFVNQNSIIYLRVDSKYKEISFHNTQAMLLLVELFNISLYGFIGHVIAVGSPEYFKFCLFYRL